MFAFAVAPGIELRLFERRHAAEMFALIDRNREHLRPWFFWAETTTSVEVLLEFLGQALDQYTRGDGAHLGIWVEGVLAGSIGCHTIDWRNRSTSLGYWIDAAYQGRGIVTQCCRAWLNYLFFELDLHRIEIRCATANVRSAAIPRRLGFVHEGQAREAEYVSGGWHDLLIFSMLARDWAGISKRSTAEVPA
jgi:ribosomal-protein-serine acetyltransferase